MIKTHFIGAYEGRPLDELINQWLEDNSDKQVKDIKLTSTTTDGGNNGLIAVFAALIIYEDGQDLSTSLI